MMQVKEIHEEYKRKEYDWSDPIPRVKLEKLVNDFLETIKNTTIGEISINYNAEKRYCVIIYNKQ